MLVATERVAASLVTVEALSLFLYNVDFDDFCVRVWGAVDGDGWTDDYRTEWLQAWKRGLSGLWGKADTENKRRIIGAALAMYGDEAARRITA